MAFLKNEEIGNASGLYNLVRNIGGSVGISIVNMIISRHEQLHRTELSASLNAGRSAMEGSVHGLQNYIAAQGSSSVDAMQQAYAVLGADLNSQSRLWAYTRTSSTCRSGHCA
jgi:DHA2 family multidrug resistance protein